MTVTEQRPVRQPSYKPLSTPAASRGDTLSSLFAGLRLPISAALATILASISLGGVFLTGGWFFPSAFGVITVGIACEVARRTSVPRTAVPFVGLAALLVYVVYLYARDEAYYWLVPSHDAITHLRDLSDGGRKDIRQYAAPIAVSPGIEFLVVGGVGLVAVAVDTLAVTMRRAALAGLALLAIYTVPTAVAPDGVGWVAFALGGVGYLTLLLAEARERVSRWGRPMRYTAPRPNWRPDVETAPLAQVGRRVGAAALGLALVVPAVLPNIDASVLGLGGNGFGRGSGGGRSVVVVNPILDLGKDLRRGAVRDIIEYKGKETYVRLTALDVFTGDRWAPSQFRVSNKRNDVTVGFTSPPGFAVPTKRTHRTYQMQVRDLDTTWLPLPYPPESVSNISGRWVYDKQTFNVIPTNGTKSNFGYTVDAWSIEPTAENLNSAQPPPDSLSKYLELPTDMPTVVDQTAREWTADATTMYQKAVAIQERLRSDEFQYNTHVEETLGDANGSLAIARFLELRQGYCVHFASTMAVMARDLGIPARVAVGFTPGHVKGDGTHVITTHDAHAWPELYFQGVGWTRFEPTPGGARTPEPSYSTGLPAPGGGAGGAAGGNGPGGNGNAPGNPRAAEGIPKQVQPVDPGTSNPNRRGANSSLPVEQSLADRLPLLPIGIGVVLVLLALLPMAARAWIRHERWRRATSPGALATATWAELTDTLLDYGYDWPASDPPRRGAERVAEERGLRGEPLEALRRLASATERARYAPELGAVGDLRADVETVRGALREQATRWERLRARVLPRSARALSQALGERFADLLDAVDAWAGRLRPRRAA